MILLPRFIDEWLTTLRAMRFLFVLSVEMLPVFIPTVSAYS